MSNDGSFWQKSLQKFWWLRGVAAAMTLVALIPNITDLSRYEFLRALHAIVIGWNTLLDWVGGIIGNIPYFPELDHVTLNILFFISTFIIPVYIVANKERKNFLSKPIEGAKLYKLYVNITGRIISTSMIISVIYLSIVYSYYISGKSVTDDIISVDIFDYTEITKPELIFVTYLFIFVFALYKSWLLVPAFKHGIVLVVGFIATVEFFYIVQLPILADLVNATACGVLDVPMNEC